MDVLLSSVIEIARKAGSAIMDIYKTDYEQYEKSDSSPLTEADLAAHHIIIDGLKAISDYPCLSEESGESDGVDWQQRKSWGTYWLIDPLDGTKEFINKNDEFTVNIALIENGKAILGNRHDWGDNAHAGSGRLPVRILQIFDFELACRQVRLPGKCKAQPLARNDNPKRFAFARLAAQTCCGDPPNAIVSNDNF